MTKSKDYIALEDKHGAHNYHPIPAVLSRGEGVFVWDVDGKKYYDFLSAYSAVNQGHCHPRIINALKDQADKLTLTSRAFHNDILGPFEQFVTQMFGFDKFLPMNSGAEAVETAIKVCRKWGHDKKGIAQNQGKIVVFDQNFHGRTTTIVSFSSDPAARKGFGPFTHGFVKIPYNDIDSLQELSNDPEIIGVLVEPIQGEAGVNVPDDDFIPAVAKFCRENNALFIADEIQTGIARTGSLLAVCGEHMCETKCDWDLCGNQPDILILGKALSGGVYPVSGVLANNSVMEVITPGTHGSTFGGNPLACRVAMEALQVVIDEKLVQNARKLGIVFRDRMKKLVSKSDLVEKVRGKGLLNAVVINDHPDSSTAWNICLALMEKGLLAKPTHGNIIRFAPPLVMTEEQLHECCDIIEEVILNFKA